MMLRTVGFWPRFLEQWGRFSHTTIAADCRMCPAAKNYALGGRA
jgi:hypothetical protein